MKNFAAALLFALALSAAALGQTAAPPKDAAQDEAAIRAAIRSVQDGWNAHDGKAFAAPFAADADYVVVNGMYLKGREAIEQGHAQIFSTIYKGSRNAAAVKGVRFIRPDVAVAHVEWNLEFKVGGETRKARAVNTMILTKEDGRWSIAAFQNTPVQTQGGPPPAQGQSRP
ncbi:MAG TPA: SgcJ/EcaC family oxidoreductase [Pyrinomonadaceae bacterium]